MSVHVASPAESRAGGYRWFSGGDLNGFFGLMFDNLTVLSFLAFILITGFGFPAEIVYRRMFPGTALAVMLGDLAYTWMAFRLAARTGNRDVTAMPLGLDTPSTIGMTFTVLGPAFIMYKHRYGVTATSPQELVDQAAMATWYLGMAVMVYVGLIKIFFSFFGNWLQRVVPQAGLLGSLAGIGLCLLGFLPMVEIFRLPVVGAVSLGLILYTLVAGIRLPRNLPGVAVAVFTATLLYYVLHLVLPADLLGGGGFTPPSAQLRFALPLPSADFVRGLRDAVDFLPIAIPFGILTIIGGINVTESARVAGDEYDTRQILLTDAIATLVAGICGGMAQSTPYIGQPAYKAMGSRAGYTLITGLFVGLGGILGYVSFIVGAIPPAALAPILVFVALDIMTQAFLACPPHHAPAVGFAYLPSVARLVWIQLTKVPGLDLARFFVRPEKPDAQLPELPVINALGNGFVVAAMLWGAFMAQLIERRLRSAAFYLVILAALTFFGVVHSVHPDGQLYLPWDLSVAVNGTVVPAPHLTALCYQFTAAYLVLAALLFGLSFTAESSEPRPEALHGEAPFEPYQEYEDAAPSSNGVDLKPSP